MTKIKEGIIECNHPRVMLITTQKGNILCTQCKTLWFSKQDLDYYTEKVLVELREKYDEVQDALDQEYGAGVHIPHYRGILEDKIEELKAMKGTNV